MPDIKKTAELVQEIAAGSNEQSQGAEQINKAIQQLDNVTQQNASTSEETASTAEELSTQAEQLHKNINFFKMDSQGGAVVRQALPQGKDPAPLLPREAKRPAVALDMGEDDGDEDFERF